MKSGDGKVPGRKRGRPPKTPRVSPQNARRAHSVLPEASDTSNNSEEAAARTLTTMAQSCSFPILPLIALFFVSKGGVGKTTTLLNVAAIFAAQGKRVLMVDCDPQCSLTKMCTQTYDDANGAKQLHKKHEKDMKEHLNRELNLEGVEEELANRDERAARRSRMATPIKLAIPAMPGGDLPQPHSSPYAPAQAYAKFAMLNKGKGGRGQGDDTENNIYQAMYNFKYNGPRRSAEGWELPELQKYRTGVHEGAPEIFLLPGDSRLMEHAIPRHNDPTQQRAIFGLRWQLLRLAEKHECDMILIDASPTTCKLNDVLILTADVIQPSLQLDMSGYDAYNTLATEVLPIVRDGTLIQANNSLQQRFKAGGDWAANLYEAQHQDRDAQIGLPIILPTLAYQYAMQGEKLSQCTSSVLQSMHDFMKAENVHRYIAAKQFDLFQKDSEDRFIIPFLPHIEIFEVANFLGRPLALLTVEEMNVELNSMAGSRKRKTFEGDLKKVAERFKWLANTFSIAAAALKKKELSTN